MKRMRDILVALAITGVILGVTTTTIPATVKPEEVSQVQQSQPAEGIPDQIQGVWSFTSQDNYANQSIVLRGNQLIITDDLNGTIYYTVTKTSVENNFATDGIEDTDQRKLYILTTDLNDFTLRYGEQSQQLRTDTFYFVYDEATDSLITQAEIEFHRNSDEEQVYIIKDQLIDSQPINREQLRLVDDRFLIESYQSLEANTSHDIHSDLYRIIRDHFPELNLLNDQDYETYQDLAGKLLQHASITYSRLSQADPRYVLNLYLATASDKSLTDDASRIIAILTDIESAIQSFQERQLRYENSLRKKP